MPLQNAHVIDLIAQDPATNVLVLGMTEPRPWDGSDRRIFELQEKVNAYLSFALDGEMAAHFPQFADKTVRLQLECVEPPDEKTNYFIGIIREQIGFQGIEFEVKVNPELPAGENTEITENTGCCGGGGGCGCAEAAPGSHSDHGLHHAHAHSHESGSGCCGGHSGNGCGCS